MKMEFVDKIKTTIANLDEKNRYYVFGGVLLFVFLLDYLILMGPQLGALSKLNPENKILIEDIQTAKSEIQKLAQYRQDIVKMNEEMVRINARVRQKEEVPLVLETITLLANKNDVKIEQITPNPVDQKLLLDNKERKYYSLPIDIQAKAGYHNFGRFLNQIEREGLYLGVKNFTITPGAESRNEVIKITLKAVVYEVGNEKK